VAINECSEHGIIASKRCAVCHKPMCIHCDNKDLTCSPKCFKSRQKFAFTRRAPRGERSAGASAFVTLLKLGVLGAVAYAAARYFGYL
jgi:hypothetical protein